MHFYVGNFAIVSRKNFEDEKLQDNPFNNNKFTKVLNNVFCDLSQDPTIRSYISEIKKNNENSKDFIKSLRHRIMEVDGINEVAYNLASAAIVFACYIGQGGFKVSVYNHFEKILQSCLNNKCFGYFFGQMNKEIEAKKDDSKFQHDLRKRTSFVATKTGKIFAFDDVEMRVEFVLKNDALSMSLKGELVKDETYQKGLQLIEDAKKKKNNMLAESEQSMKKTEVSGKEFIQARQQDSMGMQSVEEQTNYYLQVHLKAIFFAFKAIHKNISLLTKNNSLKDKKYFNPDENDIRQLKMLSKFSKCVKTNIKKILDFEVLRKYNSQSYLWKEKFYNFIANFLTLSVDNDIFSDKDVLVQMIFKLNEITSVVIDSYKKYNEDQKESPFNTLKDLEESVKEKLEEPVRIDSQWINQEHSARYNIFTLEKSKNLTENKDFQQYYKFVVNIKDIFHFGSDKVDYGMEYLKNKVFSGAGEFDRIKKLCKSLSDPILEFIEKTNKRDGSKFFTLRHGPQYQKLIGLYKPEDVVFLQSGNISLEDVLCKHCYHKCFCNTEKKIQEEGFQKKYAWEYQAIKAQQGKMIDARTEIKIQFLHFLESIQKYCPQEYAKRCKGKNKLPGCCVFGLKMKFLLELKEKYNNINMFLLYSMFEEFVAKRDVFINLDGKDQFDTSPAEVASYYGANNLFRF